MTKEEVQNFMRKQPNRQVRKYGGSNSYTAPFARFEYQFDIMDMVSLVKDPEADIKVKDGEMRYALVVIDIFSKLANDVPMESKNSPSILNALKESFMKMGTPMSVYTDDDGVFKSVMGQFLKDEGTKHITTLTPANVAERFIRAIKNMIHGRVGFKHQALIHWVITKR